MILRALSGSILITFLLAGTTAAQTPAEWQDVVRNLRHPNPATRLDAVERLASAGYYTAAEAVAPLIIDPDDRVQLAAIDAQLRFFQADRVGGGGLFGRGSRSAALEAFEAGPLLRGFAVVPAPVLDALLQAVRDPTPRVQFDAVHAFGFLAEAPLSAELTARLAAELDHYDPTIRASTARVLGRVRATGAADGLMAALGDSSPVVRRYATEALGLVRETRSAPLLRDQLTTARGEQAAVTLLALARLGAAEDVALFRERVVSRDAAIRAIAVEGLGRSGDTASRTAIEGLVTSDRSYAVQAAAMFALHLMGQEQSHTLAALLVIDDVNPMVRDYLIEIGPPAVPGIISTLRVATDVGHRADLVRLIGHLGSPEHIAVLEPLAADRNERLRRAVATAITRLKR